MKKIIFILILLANIANAQPSIRTAVIHTDGIITVDGSGFGVKTPAQPILFDDFENGISGDLIKNNPAFIGQWQSGAGDDQVFYNDVMGYGECGGRSAEHRFNSQKWAANLCQNGSYETLYIDFKQYYPSINGYPSTFSPYILWGNNNNTSLIKTYNCSNASISYASPTEYIQNNVNNLKLDTWNHYQILYKQSNIYEILNGIQETSINTVISDELDQIRVGNYFNVQNSEDCITNTQAFVYTDNIYIDNTLARIELGDDSNYNTANRDIQVPILWNEQTVRAYNNSGPSFRWENPNHNENTFVFVFDSQNRMTVAPLERTGPAVINITSDIAIGYHNMIAMWSDRRNHGIRYITTDGDRFELIFHDNIIVPTEIPWVDSDTSILFISQAARALGQLIDTDYTSKGGGVYIGSYIDTADGVVRYFTKRRF